MTVDRTKDLAYAATDVYGYYAPENTAAPTDFADLSTPWTSLGWISTDGLEVKQDISTKDLNAAGTLEPILVIEGANKKTFALTFLEAFRPSVRALYDNVLQASLAPAAGGSIATYDLPEQAQDLRYAFVFRTFDGNGKKIGFYLPSGKVSDRGDGKTPTQDATTYDMTVTAFQGSGGAAAVSVMLDYASVDVSRFFS